MRWAVILVLVVLSAACSGDEPGPEPTPGPAPSGSARLLEPGTQVDLTATVTRVLSATAFLLADTDLPADGQVVVSETPVTVRITDVVTVAGRVARFDAAAFARYGVSDSRVHRLSGGVVIVATSVRRYLPESAIPSPHASPTPGPQASPAPSPPLSGSPR